MPAIIRDSIQNRIFAALLFGTGFLVAYYTLQANEPLQTTAQMRGSTPANFVFAVMGDFGTGEDSQRQVAQHLSAVTKKHPLQLVISTGDQMYNMVAQERLNGLDGVQDVYDDKFQTHFEDVYGNSFQGVPWYMTLGNHDCAGNATAQILYTKRSPSGIWHMPSRYYTFQQRIGPGNPSQQDDVVRFIVLDSCSLSCGSSSSTNDRCKHVHRVGSDGQDANQLRNKQIEWFKQLLETPLPTENSWIVVSTHWPVYSVIGNGPTGNMIQDIEPLLKEAVVLHRGKVLWFNGHDHGLQHLQNDHNDVTNHYFVSGGGGYQLHPTLKLSADGAYKDEQGQVQSTLNKDVFVRFKKSCYGFMTVQFNGRGKGIVSFYESVHGKSKATLIYQVTVP